MSFHAAAEAFNHLMDASQQTFQIYFIQFLMVGKCAQQFDVLLAGVFDRPGIAPNRYIAETA